MEHVNRIEQIEEQIEEQIQKVREYRMNPELFRREVIMNQQEGENMKTNDELTLQEQRALRNRIRNNIRIVVEKIRTKDGAKYRITNIDARKSDNLPCRYLQSYPRFRDIDKGEWALISGDEFAGGRTFRLYPGKEFFPKEFDEVVIPLIKKAGYNLKKINDQIREEVKNWDGTKIYEI